MKCVKRGNSRLVQKHIPLIKLIWQSIIDCSSALHLGLLHLTWLRLTMAADVKLMTGLASVWEFD